jgi:hypothetical protein
MTSQPRELPVFCITQSPSAVQIAIGQEGGNSRRSAPDGHLRAITRLVATIVAALAMLPSPAHAEEIGRLFFTPVQRQDLDRRRATNAQAAVVTAVDQVTVNGQVSRSGGKSTTWINGAPQEDIRTRTDAKDPTRVTVRQGEETQGSSLRVGETLDRVRGETRDGLDGGKILIKRERK